MKVVFLHIPIHTIVESLRKFMYDFFPDMFEPLGSFGLLWTPGPVPDAGEDIGFYPLMERLNGFLSEELIGPVIPFPVEGPDERGSDMFIADCVVDGVVGREFEMSEGPVVAYRSQEVVHSGVFYSEFAWVIGVYGDCKAEAEEDGG